MSCRGNSREYTRQGVGRGPWAVGDFVAALIDARRVFVHFIIVTSRECKLFGSEVSVSATAIHDMGSQMVLSGAFMLHAEISVGSTSRLCSIEAELSHLSLPKPLLAVSSALRHMHTLAERLQGEIETTVKLRGSSQTTRSESRMWANAPPQLRTDVCVTNRADSQHLDCMLDLS